MKIRLFTPEDYDTAMGWWKAHDWPGVPLLRLPPLGVICESDDGSKGHAMGWAYMCNGGTGVAMIEWLVANPENTGRESFAAIRHVVGFLREELKRLDYCMVLTSCQQSSLAKILGKCGFTKTDEGIIHLISVLED